MSSRVCLFMCLFCIIKNNYCSEPGYPILPVDDTPLPDEYAMSPYSMLHSYEYVMAYGKYNRYKELYKLVVIRNSFIPEVV